MQHDDYLFNGILGVGRNQHNGESTRTYLILRCRDSCNNPGSIAKLCEYDSAMKRNELAELSAFAIVAEERSFRLERF